MSKIFSGCVFLATALLAGCQQTTTRAKPEVVQVVNAVYDIEGPTWVLYHLNGQAVDVAQRSAGLRFHGATARVYGTSGLNQFSGGYRVSSTSVSFLPLALDVKQEGTPAQVALEQDLLATLARVSVWHIQEGVLVLSEGTKPVAYFMRYPEPAPAP